MRRMFLIGLTAFGLQLASAQQAADVPAQNWPQWRGPLKRGEAVNVTPPVKWSDTENIRWKCDIPGKGLSTPVVWEDQIILTTAIPLDQVAEKDRVSKQNSGPFWMKLMRWSKTTDNVLQYVVYSISRTDGSVLWRTPVREDLPHEGVHKDASWASNSAVTDGEHIIASFGSAGLYCLDMHGNILWEKDFGQMHIKNTFGEGISPALYRDRVVIAWDHEGASFITAVDKLNGHTLWKVERDEDTNWSTPLIVEAGGRAQVVRPGSSRSYGYDLETGDVIWSAPPVSKSACPTPVEDGGVVYIMGSFRGGKVQAIQLDGAQGKLDSTNHILWTYDENTPYIPSPVLYRGRLYFLKDYKAELTCLDARSGKVYYTKQKLEGMKGVYASPVAGAGKVYIAGRNGVVYVVQAGDDFKVLSVNELDDVLDASPVLLGSDLILRGSNTLYCISED